ncbi:nucleotidyltransferase AbiEii toxin of type IV toxin-antitoxin system [Mucilaginibacter gracilis]|uniref:Nucleotidyltransferase AbiEii toxin of type IV toxin-antitoxin system n=1 Tax=Mucilaginibacter gracilis TaxID=423350 RepID=A0A495J5R8_9SPHI|nr:nucleotidyl transferase AbiEii/AbiGii toxin family protein [Mucilaginibacter gracilis]RKR84071.1 nucleotidyltransferase AbiEii toxin of type IV toxin-antitoxin system [Mucilaginibacter gracilis]
MIGWLKLTDAQRKTSIDQASLASGIGTKAIEKDWWVTLTLKALFATEYADSLIFKGGTSLSKCWKLIERFSEDIDIALDPKVVGMEYADNPSRGYLGNLKKRGCKFTSTLLKDALEQQFQKIGIPEGTLTIIPEDVEPTMTDKDPQTLFVRYISLYDPNPYLADEVKIEVGIRSKLEPYSKVAIHSILNEVYPNEAYSEEPILVQSVEPHKTFLQKAFLLHEEFKKPDPAKIRTGRMSRHFYDLERMMDSATGKKALESKELYLNIIAHREKYNTMKGLDYATLQTQTIDFTPPDDLMAAYQSDYATMREQMIYGDSLEPVQLFDRIKELLERFRGIHF